MNPKLVPAVLLLFVVMAAGLAQSFRSADAAVSGPLVASAPSMTSNGTPLVITVPLGAPATDDIIISANWADNRPSGVMLVQLCTPDCPGEHGEATSDSEPDPITVETDGLSQIVLALRLTCQSTGEITVTARTNDSDARSINITCNPVSPSTNTSNASGGSTGIVPGVGQFTLTAAPNLLPCEGGDSVITAGIIQASGVTISNIEVHFRTSSGAINKTSSNTARLTLGSNQIQATVTATFYYDVNGRADRTEATVNVSLACNAGSRYVVVTASPNVIDCTGTTTITASVRDANGHVIPGLGYHFKTNAGLLRVEPPSANTEDGIATLSLRPGDVTDREVHNVGIGGEPQLAVEVTEFGTIARVTVTVTVNGQTGSVEVIQRCLSTQVGQIRVNASSNNLHCGQNVFIGLNVVDEDIQTVVNSTPMTLIATHGGFYGGEGVLLSAAQVPTTRGEANVIYYAPANFNGEVKITAASGDNYGYQTLKVTCVGAPNTGTGSVATTGGGGGGVSAAPVQPCVSIGDGRFINPNTGATCNPNQIRPPNTGSAGLK